MHSKWDSETLTQILTSLKLICFISPWIINIEITYLKELLFALSAAYVHLPP